MLRVSLVGNLGAEPEQRYTQKGAVMATFRVAVNQIRTDVDGERQESTEWFRVRAMGGLAEAAQRLSKGGRVLVVGRLDITRYQSRDGEPQTGFDVWADEVVSLSSRPTDNGRDAVGAATAKSAASATGDPAELDDLPF